MESQNKITLEETCENFNKILTLYVDVLENIKELKQKKENEDKKISNSNQYVYNYNYEDCIREQFDETEKEERVEFRERKISEEKLMKNLSPNGGIMRTPNYTDSDKTNVFEEEYKFGMFEMNNHVKRKNSIKSPDMILFKHRESQMSTNILEGLQPYSGYTMKPVANSNIKRPVYKKSTSMGVKYNHLMTRKLTSKHENINDILNNNSTANGNNIEDKIELIGKLIINFK